MSNVRIALYKKIGDNVWYSDPEILANFSEIRVASGIKKFKDSFSFTIPDFEDEFFRLKYFGDGTTTTFDLKHYPIPTEIQEDSDEFSVLINGEVNNNWTIDNASGTITFSTPPANGSTIDIRYRVIKVDDTVKIWIWDHSGEPTDDDLVIDGVVIKTRKDQSSSKNLLKIEGVSWIEVVFNSMTIVDSQQKTAPEIIQQILNFMNNNNPGREIYWDSSNPTTKSDGSDFPIKNYTQNYKRVIDMIEEVSSDEFTEDGQYLFYIRRGTDGKNYFVWYRKDYGSGSIPEISSTNSKIIDLRFEKKTDNMINAIIFVAGRDCNNNIISGYNADYSSIGKYGLKMKFTNLTKDIAETIIMTEISSNSSAFSLDSQGNPKSLYPTSYPYTFVTLKQRNENTGEVTINAITVNSDDEYNAIIRNEARWRGVEQTKKYIDMYKNPRYFVTITSYFDNSYTAGQLYYLNFPQYGLNNIKMRLTTITHQDITTMLELEEDFELVIQ